MDRQPNSRMCFICGLQNPIGLKMLLYNDLDHQQVVSTITISDEYQGYPGVVHGGIVATMLDEIGGRATLISGDPNDLMVTANLDVKYRQPTPLNTPLTIIGRVTRPGKLRARAHSEIQLPDGTITAEADLLLTRPPGNFMEGWAEERRYWRVYENHELPEGSTL